MWFSVTVVSLLHLALLLLILSQPAVHYTLKKASICTHSNLRSPLPRFTRVFQKFKRDKNLKANLTFDLQIANYFSKFEEFGIDVALYEIGKT